MPNKSFEEKLALTAARIRDMREISGFTVAEMAEKTDTTEKEYRNYEEGKTDFPFNFLHKCALAFGIDLLALLEGSTPKLRTYTVTRNGEGEKTVDENGIQISRLAPLFSNKLAEPYYVKYAYSAEQQNTMPSGTQLISRPLCLWAFSNLLSSILPNMNFRQIGTRKNQTSAPPSIGNLAWR